MKRQGMAALIALTVMSAAPTTVLAADPPATLTGKAMVVDSGTLMLGGIIVKLWGIASLAPDQQCWRGEVAWACGEQATDALRHYVEDAAISCVLKPVDKDNFGQCTRDMHGSTQDLSAYMVEFGYAVDDAYTSNGLYADKEDTARTQKRGIWSGRFQTAEDWRNGIQRYVGEDSNSDDDTDDNASVPEPMTDGTGTSSDDSDNGNSSDSESD